MGFGSDDQQLLALDRLVQRCLPKAALFATSLTARGRTRGRLSVYARNGSMVWTEVHRRHVQLVADLAGVAIENDQMLQDARRHERVDRQLSIGAEIQAQLLPDRCPVIEGVDLAARCRPAFQAVSYTHLTLPTNREV